MNTISFHYPISSTVLFIFLVSPVLISFLNGFAPSTTVQGFVLQSEREISKLLFSASTTNVKWEVAQLRFLTPIRHRRDLSRRDFHILELQRPSSNSTLTIHLSKKPTLLSPLLKIVVHHDTDNIKEVKADELDASSSSVFKGTVISSDLNNGVNRENGRAALSVCGQHSGFCGLIVTENNEHLMIQPHTESDDPDEPNVHVLMKIDEADRTSQCTISDEVRVPPEKLKEAAYSRYSTKDERLKDGSPPPHDDASRLMSSSLLTPVLTSPSKDEKSPFDSINSYSSKSNLDGNWNTGMSKQDKKIVEIAVFTDEDLYHQLRKKFPKDTIKKMKDYVITMINTMDMLYGHSSLGVGIEFSLVHLEIMKKYPHKLNKNGGRAMAYLTSFCDYAGEKNTNSEMWDHALLLTGMDLREDDTSATAGLAWAGTMCYRYYSCSISEGASFGAAYIITHEIGHSLGMEHDGNGVGKACDREKYLMSPTTGPGKIEWSACSRQALNDYVMILMILFVTIQYGSSELRNTKNAHKPLCLSESALTKNGSNQKINVSEGGHFPGQKYNASQQCVLAMGNQFRPVLRRTEAPFDNICWMLYCGNGTHAISTHPALEGTKCDDGKHCRSGKCIKRS